MIKDLVSVIIPAYNSEKFIKLTLESVLNQTYKDIEVIVLDDGSTDKTALLIENIAKHDKRVKYFYQSNQGLANSRNRLCELASGEYIAFLDHDDEWLSDKLKIQLALFREREDCALVYGNVLNVYTDGSRNNYTYFENRQPYRGKVFYEYLIEGNFAPQPSIIIKSEILRRYLPFNPELKIAVDWELLLRLARDYSFDYVDEVVAIYNLHSDRATTKNALLEIEEILKIMDFWYRTDSKLRLAYRSRYLRARAKINMQKTYLYQNNHNFKKEFAEIVNCLCTDPTWFKPYLKLIKTSLFIIMATIAQFLGRKTLKVQA